MITINGRKFDTFEAMEEWLVSKPFIEWIEGDVFPIDIKIDAGEQGPVNGELKYRDPWLIGAVKTEMSDWSITYTSPWMVEMDPTKEQKEALSALRVIAAQINAVLNLLR